MQRQHVQRRYTGSTKQGMSIQNKDIGMDAKTGT